MQIELIKTECINIKTLVQISVIFHPTHDLAKMIGPRKQNGSFYQSRFWSLMI